MKNRERRGSASGRADAGAPGLRLPVGGHLRTGQAVEGKALGLGAIEDGLLDGWGEQGQLQVHPQAALGDAVGVA